MRKPSLLLFTFFFSVVFIVSCSTEKEELQAETIADYFNLEKDKFITYRLDSLVFTQSGRAEEVHSYQEKHIVDAQITDNLGQPAFRIFRFQRDTAGTQPWKPAGTYLITPLKNTAEVTEDNMRVIKLIAPVTEGSTWKGNRFLSTEPFSLKYNFSNDDNMEDWDFTIDQRGETLLLNGKTLTNVTTVLSIDEALNAPVTDVGSYGARTLGVEKFAKGIGLVYQEFEMWEYQPNSGGTPYKVGFGVKRSMIEHN